jgi:maleate isomerase
MDGDTGFRRIGVLVGDTDPIVEYDLQRFLPRHISFHVGRLDMPEGAQLAADASLQMMCDSAPKAARKVAAAEVEAFLFACTAASFFRGEGWDRQVARSITEATGVHATTTATSVADALEALGARKIFLITPYSPEVNAREITFLGYRGVEVVGQDTFGCTLSRDVSHVSPEAIVERVRACRSAMAGADALFVSCTMLRVMEVSETLEAELGMPVVTSNGASLWAVLRAIGEEHVPAAAMRAMPSVVS